MKSAPFVVGLLVVAFVIGLLLTVFSKRPTTVLQEPAVREFTLEGMSTVPANTAAATIVGSVSTTGTIPPGSTMNVEARQTGMQQFTTVLQNLPAATQTFSYTKAISGTYYDVKVTLLDPSSNVIGSSQIRTVSAPSLYTEFAITVVVPSVTAAPTPTPTPRAQQSIVTPTPTILATPTPSQASISGTLTYQGVAPLSARVVVLQKLANASSYAVAVDNLSPLNGTTWQWAGAAPGKSYTLLAVLKQKRSDGSDIDLTYSAPVTITAPVKSIALTINFSYTLPKPSDPLSVSCNTYNSGANQNTWNVTVTVPTVSGAFSYWLVVGSTDGATDIINTYGSATSAPAVFKNSTTYYGRYAYSAVTDADSGSGQYSIFSDTTRLSCGN